MEQANRTHRPAPGKARPDILARRHRPCDLERAAAELQSGTSQAAEWALKLWEKANKIMSGLALRLRLGPQSRREKAKVERPLTWDEKFRLEKFGRL